MQKYKLFGLAPPIWVAQYIYSIDIQRIIKCESKRCQSQENVHNLWVQRFCIRTKNRTYRPKDIWLWHLPLPFRANRQVFFHVFSDPLQDGNQDAHRK